MLGGQRELPGYWGQSENTHTVVGLVLVNLGRE